MVLSKVVHKNIAKHKGFASQSFVVRVYAERDNNYMVYAIPFYVLFNIIYMVL